jgi:eukaryotic-like serine/threonine-protein kinase
VAGVVRPGRLSGDIMILRPGSAADTVVVTEFDEHSPAVSPDGRMLAYASTESGQLEVHVRALATGRGGRAVASERGGSEPVWSRDGRELFYLEKSAGHSRLLAARVMAGDPPRVESRRVVMNRFPSEPVGNHANWDLLPDGRFLIAAPESQGRLGLIFNWAPPRGRR